ncbi:hypothetical protein M2227_003445 [Bradyrhizobium elkanii]|uniref:hypothetical protein n=1 Tax=Bradyrhizobium elkanii TaxID=29448 RepID=UPI002225D832|nr:hypothetical protein [Bradyrhizobium elkanii]MCW2110271.1 hypothetical protein [Bradyrhizobium elkanii]MCW2110475.1 hypothetical protein [Bradyrhizobium elkanii]MCW2201355.1 hypothetical protein [Bradyrhizobium elkanii]MCW2226994.1 hypothetical protein [Bradyrhizobium elkanii]WLB68249.1 hypothetical protein QIH89_23100 [Bradyrhizobium elkanii]
MTTISKALPPGTNHHAATEALASATEATVKALAAQQSAPRPAGTTVGVTVELPVKSKR